MIFLELFLTFFKIGCFCFGGYSMIPIVRQEVLANEWMEDEMVTNFLAVAESTPGPIAVNMATFVGSMLGIEEFGVWGGLLGSAVATLGVVLPAFLIILLVAAVFKNLEQNKYFKAVISGIKPVCTGLIAATGLMLIIKCVFVNFGYPFDSAIEISWMSVVTLAILGVAQALSFIIRKKQIPPILLIVVSAGIGMILF